MHQKHLHWIQGALAALALLIMSAPAVVYASSWDPTLIVNTESFATIDDGNGTTDIELRFGDSGTGRLLYDQAQDRFRFDRDLTVPTLTATGTIRAMGDFRGSGALAVDGNMTLNEDNTAADAIITFGNDAGAETLRFSDTINEFLMSDDLRVLGQMSGASLSVAGGGVTISDQSATVFNEFSQDSDFRIEGDTNANLFFLDASTDRIGLGTATPETRLEVVGTMSGLNLVVSSGGVKINTVQYMFPGTQGGANQTLVNDGYGNLTWGAMSAGNGSGGIFFLQPEYPHAVYFGSGTSAIGQLKLEFDTTNKENYYRWTTTKTAIQDYWISARVRVPDNFSSWDPVKPIEFRYRTNTASAADNHLTVRFLDTANTEIALTGNAALASTTFATATITGPQAAGTYTAGSYVTVLVKVAATRDDFADAGYVELNWETTTP